MNNRHKKIITEPSVILYILIMLSLAAVTINCEEPQEEPVTITQNKEDIPDQELWASPENPVIIRITDDEGKIQNLIKAGHIQIFRKKKTTFVDSGITVDFYNSEGDITSTLTAKRGILYENTKDLIAYENVVVHSTDERKLETEELRWYDEEQKIVAPLFVKITTEKGYEEGNNLESNTDLTHFTIWNVRGKVLTERKMGE